MDVIVSPHIDDAMLSCWGVLMGGRPVKVVDVCAGLPPPDALGEWDARSGAASSRRRVEERRREEALAQSTTGAEVVYLDFLDWQYGPEEDRALEDVAAALAPELAGAAWVYAPAGIGGHRDHQRVRDAVLLLQSDAVLYADLPYALRDGYEPLLPGYVAEEVELDETAAAAKVAALQVYATQLPLLEADFGPLLDPRALAREVLYHRV